MTLREITEERERKTLSPFAALSVQSEGRLWPIEPCPIRTCYQRDIDRIVHSKAFRRLMHKTQVFLRPEGDHYRTRMTHTLEVARIARTIARGLALNEDLTEAIALGHDLGHTPFGHAGERVLDEILPGGFRHNEQSLRVVDCLEKEGEGLNLCYEVRRGIIYPLDIPLDISQVLGFDHGGRIDTLTLDVIQASRGQDEIRQSPACGEAMAKLREFMFEAVYYNPLAKGEESKAQDMIARLFEHYQKHPDELPPDYQDIRLREGTDRAVCDYIAGMTDHYAVAKYNEAFVPLAWAVK